MSQLLIERFFLIIPERRLIYSSPPPGLQRQGGGLKEAWVEGEGSGPQTNHWLAAERVREGRTDLLSHLREEAPEMNGPIT